jgi:ergothioneine biosynthesis protein EgtB
MTVATDERGARSFSDARAEDLACRFRSVRSRTIALVAPLSDEDQNLQSMPDASPAKWHQAHTTWFFETFVLAPFALGYRPFDPAYRHLFNSYYDAVGPRHPRPRRGLLSRPSLSEVRSYRAHVDEAMTRLLKAPPEGSRELFDLVALGLAHEEQHQELILTDLKHAFACNPLRPAYREEQAAPPTATQPVEWLAFDGGLAEVGRAGPGFAFDNEGPRHKVWLEPFRLASRLVTCGEYLAFVEDGGYRRPDVWLSEGWAAVQQDGWRAPLYWTEAEEGWRLFTLGGERTLNPAEPVAHLSWYEADAFARWSGARLPTESEWEIAATSVGEAAACEADDAVRPHPRPATRPGPSQFYGDLWQWTASPYVAYPGYRPASGAVGEYNGKFMSGQMVLRGGACVTPPGHARPTYRNFFPPSARWAFSGVRLARDV